MTTQPTPPTPQKASKRPNSSSGAAIESVLKWGKVAWFGVGIVTAVFLGGVAAQQYRAGLVDQVYLEGRLLPVESRIHANSAELEARRDVIEAVSGLVERQKIQQAAETERRRLSFYDREYQQALAEYSADKAANKPSARPRKTQAHLDIEASIGDLDRR